MEPEASSRIVILLTLVPAISGLVGVIIGSVGSWLAGHFQFRRELRRSTNLRLLDKAEELQIRIAALTSLSNEFIHKIGNAVLTKDMRTDYNIKIVAAYHAIHAISNLYFPPVVFDPDVKFESDVDYLENYIRELFKNENSGSWVEGAEIRDTAKVADRLSAKGIEVAQKIDKYMANVLDYMHKRLGLYDLSKRTPGKE